MTPPPRACTCQPVAGCHGITLHADQVADLTHLLATVEDLLLHTNDDFGQFPTNGLPHSQSASIHALTDELAAINSELTRASHDPRHPWTPC
jgi:hypothetical protein